VSVIDSTPQLLPVRGFSFNETPTLIAQKATGEGSNGYVALGAPKKTNRFDVYHEHRGFMARLAHSYLGASQAAYRQANFSSSLDLERVLGRDGWPTLTFNVINLNQAKRTQYLQFENATYSSYDPGRTFQLWACGPGSERLLGAPVCLTACDDQSRSPGGRP
jgi:hypothetical protein